MFSHVKNGPSNLLVGGSLIALTAGGTFLLQRYAPQINFSDDTFIRPYEVWALLMGTYALASFRFWETIGPDKIGFRQFFGKPAGEIRAGLPIVPPGLFTLKVFERTIQQKEYPAEADMIYRGEMKDPKELPEGMKPPVRQAFRTSITEKQAREFFGDGNVGPKESLYEVVNPHNKKEEITFNDSVPGDGLSKKRVTAEVYPVLRWRIYNVENFVANMGSKEEVEKQIEDEIFSVLNRICQQISLAQALQNQQWLNAILFHAVATRIEAKNVDGEWRSDEWGIQLESVYIKYSHLSHGLNQSIANASQATFTAQETITLASAEKTKLEKEGAGAAKAAKALAHGEIAGLGDGLIAAATATGMTPEQIAATKVAGQIADGGNTIILGEQGLSQVLGAATAVGKQLKEKGDNK